MQALQEAVEGTAQAAQLILAGVGQTAGQVTVAFGKRVGTAGFPTVAAAPTLLSDNGTHANLYDVIVFAADAWIGVALKGEHAVHPTMVSAKPSDSDPLGQRRKCGYKTMQSAKVTQVAHVKRIVCGALKAA